MIVVPAVMPFGIRIRHLRILSPAAFSTILIVGGVLLLLFTWLSMRNARALKAEGGKITVDGPEVTYPDVKKGKVEYRTFLTSDIEYIKDDEEENQCKVSLPDQYVVFETKYFDSWGRSSRPSARCSDDAHPEYKTLKYQNDMITRFSKALCAAALAALSLTGCGSGETYPMASPRRDLTGSRS